MKRMVSTSCLLGAVLLLLCAATVQAQPRSVWRIQPATVNVPLASQVGVVREQSSALEDIGAPSSYTFAVNGAGVDDDHILREGDIVTFRPRSGEKG